MSITIKYSEKNINNVFMTSKQKTTQKKDTVIILKKLNYSY